MLKRNNQPALKSCLTNIAYFIHNENRAGCFLSQVKEESDETS